MAKTRTSFSTGAKAGPGRTPGVPNKATKDIKEFARKALTDPAYVDALKVRLRRGTAGAVEIELYRHAYGQPKTTTEVTGPEGGPLFIGWLKPGA